MPLTRRDLVPSALGASEQAEDRRRIGRRTLLAVVPAALAAAAAAWAGGPKVSVIRILLLHNRVFIAVSINGGAPLRFALDTGDSVRASIDPRLAETLGLKFSGASTVSGIVGTDVHGYYTVHDLSIGGGVLRQEGVQLEATHIGDIDGFLPAHLLQTQDADLDFTRGELRLYWSGEADHAGYTPILYERGPGNHQVIAPCRLDDQPLRLQVDTGAPSAITLMSNYVRDHNLWSAFPHYLDTTSSGVAGSTRARVVRMQSFQIGATRFQEPIVRLLDPEHARSETPNADGLVGLDLLRRFDLSFQAFPRPTLWMRKNAALAEPFRMDRSGLVLGQTRDGVCEIRLVAPDSAGRAAGLQPGDRLPTINTVGLRRGLEWLLTDGPGTEVDLEIERHGARQPVRLVLADRV